MKVALVHYWLVGRRGGEKVLEEIANIFPESVIFTHVFDQKNAPDFLKEHEVRTSFIQNIPFSSKLYRQYLPLMPFALNQLDLSEFDLVISSESGPAKGVKLSKNAHHLCYCHTPMRYLWSHYNEYRSNSNLLTRMGMSLLKSPLRYWDRTTASCVDRFVANSKAVARRIKEYWGRNADVIYPPVETKAFGPPVSPENFYLVAGEMVNYKRFDLAIKACNLLARPLFVIGKGPEEQRLRAMAGPTVKFLGYATHTTIAECLRRCKALLFPQEEDFGILAVEAMASGRPVIAFGRGGALETVIPGRTGIFFQEQTVEALSQAVEEYESQQETFIPHDIISHARQFDKKIFINNIKNQIELLFKNSG